MFSNYDFSAAKRQIDPIISAIDRGFIALRPSPKLLEAALIFARSNNFTREHGDSDWSGFDGWSLVFIVDGVLQDAGCRMVFVLEKLWEIGYRWPMQNREFRIRILAKIGSTVCPVYSVFRYIWPVVWYDIQVLWVQIW